MNNSPSINYLERKEIDTEKWDYCIEHSPNGLIYGKSFYLDAMSANWHALVLGDYQAVMPLTWRRKFFISYLYQPAFTAQLGIFCIPSAVQMDSSHFIEAAKTHFSFCEIHLNFSNTIIGSVSRSNYILDLSKSYEEIRKTYKKRLLENLDEAKSFNLNYSSSLAFPSAIQFFRDQYGVRFPHVIEKDYLRFKNLCDILASKNMLFVREIRDTSGELLNTSIFFRDRRRIYNIMSVSLPKGREKRAHFFLLDQLIREFADNDILLDFEGSEVPGISEFYRKFGGKNQPYSFLRYNNLPFPIRLFK